MKTTEKDRKRGLRIKEVREELGFDSQPPFAKKIGVHQTTLSLWERGERKPKQEPVDKIILLYRTTMGRILDRTWLMEGTGEKTRMPPTIEAIAVADQIDDFEKKYYTLLEKYLFTLEQKEHISKEVERLKEVLYNNKKS